MRLIATILTFCFLSCRVARQAPIPAKIIINLDGSKSYDPDGYIAWVKWTQVSGPPSIIISPEKLVTRAEATIEGVRIYKLTGADNDGAIRSDTTISR